jgi:hypothetical protein
VGAAMMLIFFVKPMSSRLSSSSRGITDKERRGGISFVWSSLSEFCEGADFILYIDNG